MKLFTFGFFLFITSFIVHSQTLPEKLDNIIEHGEFTHATRIIDSVITLPHTTQSLKQELVFRKERMRRILLDFTESEDSVLKYIRKYIPEATIKDMRKWEDSKKLEMKQIDGERKYFSQAGRNLFRLDTIAKARMEAVNGKKPDNLEMFLQGELPEIVKSFQTKKEKLLNPVTISLHYALTVPGKSMKDAQSVQVWLPFPRTGHSRQVHISMLDSVTKSGVLAPPQYAHTSLCFNKKVVAETDARFTMAAQYTAYAEYNAIDFDTVQSFPRTGAMAAYVKEEYPHIRFTGEIKALSKKILGSETHKGKIVKLLFQWISDNIPWASAREYSTIPNIATYCVNESHGDCGIQSLLFITLCRYNGIPAKWQSGWMLHPGALNLHDWSEIYVQNKGWVPVDQSFGLQPSQDEKVKWFYLGNTDAYHLIVNDAISSPFYPAKKFTRSETVDFQRGEVETNRKNLYFDEWDYHMDVEYKK